MVETAGLILIHVLETQEPDADIEIAFALLMTMSWLPKTPYHLAAWILGVAEVL